MNRGRSFKRAVINLQRGRVVPDFEDINKSTSAA